MVNNAGLGVSEPDTRVHEITEEAWDLTMWVEFFSKPTFIPGQNFGSSHLLDRGPLSFGVELIVTGG